MRKERNAEEIYRYLAMKRVAMMRAKKKERVRKILLVACIGLFIYSASSIIIKFVRDYLAERDYDKLRQTPLPTYNYDNVEEERPGAFDLIKNDSEIRVFSLYPKIDTSFSGDTLLPNGRAVSAFHDKSLEINSDVVGYLKIADDKETYIEYPVVQSYLNNDYYLDKSIYKTDSTAASIFMDYKNRIYAEDKNIVLYGHNMGVGTMFAKLHKYADWKFADSHRKIIFNTLYEDMEWEVFASYETHKDFNYIKTWFRNDKEFMDLINECKKKSKFDYGITPKVTDRILTLSTCVKGNRDDYRFTVQAVLVKRTPK